MKWLLMPVTLHQKITSQNFFLVKALLVDVTGVQQITCAFSNQKSLQYNPPINEIL